jgi:hypothetical protein
VSRRSRAGKRDGERLTLNLAGVYIGGGRPGGRPGGGGVNGRAIAVYDGAVEGRAPECVT